MTAYPHTNRLLVALDIIIFGFDGESLKVLLIKRNFEPKRGQWSLMGGFLEEDESLSEAAERILHTLTGLHNGYLEQLHTFGNIDRDPVERTISVVYYSLISISEHDAPALQKHQAYWVDIEKKPDLIFDHDHMVRVALQRLRIKAAQQPIGFELLPQKFTLPQLQKLYEAIYSVKLDRRNFSRKVISTQLLVDTGEKLKQSITKKARLFTLDTQRYQTYLEARDAYFPDFTQQFTPPVLISEKSRTTTKIDSC
jgi:8-oxo-dGTP diphosphatase